MKEEDIELFVEICKEFLEYNEDVKKGIYDNLYREENDFKKLSLVLVSGVSFKNDGQIEIPNFSLPQEQNNFEKYIKLAEDNPDFFLIVWQGLNEEDKLKVLKYNRNCFINLLKLNDFSDKFQLENLIESIPNDIAKEELYKSILLNVSEDTIVFFLDENELDRKSFIISKMDPIALEEDFICDLIQNAERLSTINALADFVPNKTNKILDALTERLGDRSQAIGALGSENIDQEEIIEILKNCNSASLFKQILYKVQFDKQIIEMYNIYFEKVIQEIELATILSSQKNESNEYDYEYSDDEFLEEEYGRYEEDSIEESFRDNFLEFLSYTNPKFVTKEFFTRTIDIAKRMPIYSNENIWPFFTKEQQNKELLELWINDYINEKDAEIEKEEKLIKIINTTEIIDEDTTDIFIKHNTCKSVDVFNSLLEKVNNIEENEELKQKCIEKIIKASGINEKDSERRYKLYEQLKKYNENIDSTLNIGILDSRLQERCNFDFEDILKISSIKRVQRFLVKNFDNTQFCDFLKELKDNSENLNLILEKMSVLFTKSLVQNSFTRNFANNKEKEENMDFYMSLSRLVCNNESDYFESLKYGKLSERISASFEFCKNFLFNSEKLNLKDNNILPVSNCQKFLKVEARKEKFAIFQLLYGIDLANAYNLYMKYGKNIDNIESFENEQDKVTRTFLHSLEYIIQMDKTEIDELLKQPEFIELLNNSPAREKLGYIQDIEKRCMKIYAKEYKDVLFDANKETNNYQIEDIEYAGKKITTLELKPEFDENGNVIKAVEFFMLARVEGAYQPEWTPPDNYYDYINMPSIEYHGNCESLISNDSISLAKQGIGPTFGYTDTSGIKIQAPWDIFSEGANTMLDISSAKYNEGKGIEFNVPRGIIDNTRHGHNEVVSERVCYDENEKRVKKRMPSFVIFCKEAIDEDVEQLTGDRAKQFEECKKAASQLNIPIVFINREAIAIQEIQKLNNNLNILENNDLDDKQIEQMIKNIVVTFENNRVGALYSEEISKKYFSIENSVMSRLIELCKKDNRKQDILYNTLLKEKEKGISSLGLPVTVESEFPSEYGQFIDEVENIRSKNDFINNSISSVTNSDLEQVIQILKSVVKENTIDEEKREKEEDGK